MKHTLDLRRHGPRRLTRPGIAEMLAYWEQLRGAAPMPERAQIDPMAIQANLSHAAIVERTETGTVKLRLGGRNYQRMLGIEPRGMPLRALFDVQSRNVLSQLLDAVFDGPKVLTAAVIADRKDAPAVTGQMAVMPLTDMSGRPTRALVGFVTDPFTSDVPLRFRLRHAHLADIGGSSSSPASFGRAARPTRVQVQRGDASFLRVIDGGLS